ncbi:short-chain dehydrogenase [Haloprofundus marisrubri]|uniref:Short-chain dehydrogenase n=2 Tax=Haloprofundus marisrubri TaxID=1514971 RepID=A0A0W1RAV7_9EURY|nr:short-chain dehydrogenase [Haloprofundus marisrubri]
MLTTLLEDGYRVACLDVNVENVEPLQENYPDRLLFYRCDVTADEDVETAIESVVDRWGRIDILVNNAAVFTFGRFEDQSLADTRREFEVNYFGYVRTVRAVLPHMKAQGGGIVHNVSSGAGLVGHPGLSGYASTKGAIEALTRSLRFELEPENVACTRMHPALSNTRSAATIGYPQSLMADPAEVGRKLANQIESTDAVITPDVQTRVGLAVARQFPFIVKKGTERFVRN